MKKLLLILFGWLLPAATGATRETILGSSDRIAGYVDVPEWGGRVYLATLSVADRAKFLHDLGRLGSMDKSDTVSAALEYFNAQVKLLASALVSARSEPLFTPEDVEALSKKSPATIGKLYDEIIRVNGFSVIATEDSAKN